MNADKVINKIGDELKRIPGVAGVVLGGSRARGTHEQSSDIDIGIYYDSYLEFDVNEVGKIAAKLDDQHRENLVSSLGEWGEWINGGGWLIVQGYHVDLIFRDMNRVSQVIEDCWQGKVTSHYHAGHPHAYLNAMYMGEIAICSILFERENQISNLKKKTCPYPKPLKDALISYFMFEASFSMMFAEDSVNKDDLSYVMGHIFRTISCLNQVLFALNEEYCINEKKAVRMIEGFEKRPGDYKKRIDEIASSISSDTNKLKDGLDQLQQLITETEMLLK